MAFSERIARLKSSLIREILAAAQRPEVMSFAGGLPAEPLYADVPVPTPRPDYVPVEKASAKNQSASVQ